MVGGLEAALVFLMLVMPGLLAIGGYYQGRGVARPKDQALQTLAQAIAWSLVALILPALILASDLVDWIRDGEVAKHVTKLALCGYGTLAACYALGVVMGYVANHQERIARILGPHTATTEKAKSRRR